MIKNIIISTLLFLLTSTILHGKVSNNKAYSCTCLTSLQEELERDRYDMSVEYRQKFYSTIKFDNESEFLEGTIQDQVVILIHGFMASPFEVKEVATHLNNMGYSVYMPLLYGFGGTGQTANYGKLAIWREQIKSSVKKLSQCYKKISIGGISLGGALATDYVLNNKSDNVTSLILLSPYFDISQDVAKMLIGPLLSVKDSFDLSTLFSMSRSSDLTEVIKYKPFYSEIMPFHTLKEIFTLSEELKNKVPATLKSFPVFVATSEADVTISLSAAVDLPKKHFSDITYFSIGKDFKVPHQITYESVNPKFKDMARKIVSIIRKGSYQ